MSIQIFFVPLHHNKTIGDKEMKKVNELLDQMQPMRAEVKKRCLAYLKRVLKKAEDNTISFQDEDGNDIGNNYVCVTYDGGRHPEYASNAFSQVHGIYLRKNNKGKDCIILDTEDDDEYGIENINWDELVDLTDYVYKVVMPFLKKG